MFFSTRRDILLHRLESRPRIVTVTELKVYAPTSSNVEKFARVFSTSRVFPVRQRKNKNSKILHVTLRGLYTYKTCRGVNDATLLSLSSSWLFTSRAVVPLPYLQPYFHLWRSVKKDDETAFALLEIQK